MCSRISKSHTCTQYTLTASAPGAAGYLHRRYSLVAQLGTPKLGDTCRHSRLRRLNLPRVACIAPLPLSAACTCPTSRYLRPEPRCTCDARTCPPARPFASTALRKNISSYRLAVSPFPFSSLHHTPSVNLCFRATHRRLSPLNLFLGHQATLTQLPPSLHQSSSSTLFIHHTSYADQASPLHPPTRHHVCYQRGERLRSPR